MDEARPAGSRAALLGRVSGPVQAIVGIVLLGVVVAAVVASWKDVRPALADISPGALVLAEALVLLGLGASALTWRVALREFGADLGVAPAARVYILGQLGKYLPGSVWALAMQMELAARAGIARARALTASTVAMGVNVVTGLAIGLAVVPAAVSGGAWRVASVAAVLLISCAGLSPPVLTRVVGIGLRVFRQPELERPVSWPGILTASGWSVGSWLAYGAAVWTLAVSVGAPVGTSLPLSFGGIALAMTVGFLVVVAPSGIGVREAVIVASLAPVLDRSAALAVALVARLVFTAADLFAALAVVAVRRPAASASLR
jgi:uncharacterized membrane protein YbhN (UPF0104 family)